MVEKVSLHCGVYFSAIHDVFTDNFGLEKCLLSCSDDCVTVRPLICERRNHCVWKCHFIVCSCVCEMYRRFADVFFKTLLLTIWYLDYSWLADRLFPKLLVKNVPLHIGVFTLCNTSCVH